VFTVSFLDFRFWTPYFCGAPKKINKVLPAHQAVIAHSDGYSDWIGLRKKIQETIDFPMKYGAFL
jgi:hypothetical protein